MLSPVEGSLIVENPAEILRNEDGIFEVTSPYGHVFRVTCKRGTQMSVHEIPQPDLIEQLSPSRFVWRIRRIERAMRAAAAVS